MKNTQLAIAIPTFERAEIINVTISFLISEIQDYSIPIYISDNSSDDKTEKIIHKLKKQYDLIYYYRNRTDLGHDKNSFYVAQLPESEYVWLLGDSLQVKVGAIKNILNIIGTHKPGIISVNAVGRDLDKQSKLYDDPNAVLNDLGWHITLTGATIYSRKALDTINKVVPQNFKNFPQLSLIFNFLSEDCAFFWDNKKWISASRKKQGYWVRTMFSIFIDDWSSAIRNLPTSYNQEIKEKVIIEHSQKSNIFGFKALLKAKYLGAYDFKIYEAYKSDLLSHSKLPFYVLLFIAFFPRAILKLYFFIKGR